MKIKMLAVIVIGTMIASPVLAQRSHSVRGYTRKDGTYVAPHRQTNPNRTRSDNWSTRGNVNPYTGKAGTVDPYRTPSSTTSTSSTSTEDSDATQ